MPTTPRRRLFWRVYVTLLASLVLVALVGAVLGHVIMASASRHGMIFTARRPPRLLHMALFLLSIGAAVGLAAYPVVARMTRRLEALRAAVSAWRPDGGGQRAPVEGDDEIAAVAISFNRAAEGAEAVLAAHKALLAHASHELRSPLARLRMATEIYLLKPEPDRLAEISREIMELDGLVEEILLASRLDHPAETTADQAVDCLALAAEEAARGGVTLAPVEGGADGFLVEGSPRLLRRMIRNLIDNAIKHGAPPVEVLLERDGPDVVLRVLDHGRGVPAALREQVFAPFFRPTGESEEGGSWGLGLSLVRQIAQRHGGSAACEDHEGATEFRVRLPAASSPSGG